ncbi:MAG: Tat pathway signal protein [Sulfurospirillaceae bacterium]|nr:Tat pathway signal protein [Sulfurospirillaceae bacterium]
MQEEIVQDQRRSFIKKTLGASAVVAAVGVSAIASDKGRTAGSNGVVIGKSKKKEILYTKTAHWDAFYNAAY